MTILPIQIQIMRLQCASARFVQWSETDVLQCASLGFGQSQEKEEQRDQWESYCWSDWHYSKHVTPIWFVVRMLAMVRGDGLDVVMLTGIFHRKTVDHLVHFKPCDIWDATQDFQQCGMCNQQWLRPACAYALVAWIFYDCLATDRTAFGVSKLNRRL